MSTSDPREAIERARTVRAPGDRIRLYIAKRLDETLFADYVCGSTSLGTGGSFALSDWHDLSFAERGERSEREWRKVKWPPHLVDGDLGRLARGFTLPGGFAATESIARAYRIERVRRRRSSLVGQIAAIDRALRDAEIRGA